jgi:hypothetical protein
MLKPVRLIGRCWATMCLWGHVGCAHNNVVCFSTEAETRSVGFR